MSGRVAVGRVASLAGGLAAIIVLAGCGGAVGTGGFEADTGDKGSALGNLIAFNKFKIDAAPAATGPVEKIDCPTIEVLDGTASSRVYAGADQSNATVKYQFSLGDVVRECSHVGGQLVMKVGAEGRVLLGPSGAPGSFSAPIRIAIRREKDQGVAVSKFYSVPVTVASGETGAPFAVVSDEIAVPFTQARSDDDYTIVVGFDAKGSAPDAKVRKTRHRG